MRAVPDVDATLIPAPGFPPVLEYHGGEDVPVGLAPRPYLHPVRTLGGVVVTELQPASHRHHLGASVAVPDVDGVNFWGGRTFVPGHGPVWLDNHGTQRHRAWSRRTPTALAHDIAWSGIDGSLLLTERRTLASRLLAPGAWVLDLSFALTPARPLEIRSPAVLGREGAGYGGLFWRAPSPARAFGPSSSLVADLHGRASDWLALTGPGWTLVFAGAGAETRADPWFVRVRDYAGVGSALAWRRALRLAPGSVLTRRFMIIVADGTLDTAGAAALAGAAAEQAEAASTEAASAQAASAQAASAQAASAQAASAQAASAQAPGAKASQAGAV